MASLARIRWILPMLSLACGQDRLILSIDARVVPDPTPVRWVAVLLVDPVSQEMLGAPTILDRRAGTSVQVEITTEAPPDVFLAGFDEAFPGRLESLQTIHSTSCRARAEPIFGARVSIETGALEQAHLPELVAEGLQGECPVFERRRIDLDPGPLFFTVLPTGLEEWLVLSSSAAMVVGASGVHSAPIAGPFSGALVTEDQRIWIARPDGSVLVGSAVDALTAVGRMRTSSTTASRAFVTLHGTSGPSGVELFAAWNSLELFHFQGQDWDLVWQPDDGGYFPNVVRAAPGVAVVQKKDLEPDAFRLYRYSGGRVERLPDIVPRSSVSALATADVPSGFVAYDEGRFFWYDGSSWVDSGLRADMPAPVVRPYGRGLLAVQSAQLQLSMPQAKRCAPVELAGGVYHVEVSGTTVAVLSGDRARQQLEVFEPSGTTDPLFCQ